MKRILLLFVFAWLLQGYSYEQRTAGYEALKQGFVSPPDSTRPAVYWYFLSGHIEKEGITKDLEAMKDFGIGEVFIGDIYVRPPTSIPIGFKSTPAIGDTPSLSDKWFDCMRHAVREGRRLGIAVSFFNGPGWSQSGGPWVAPEQAMRYLKYSTAVADGPGRIEMELAKPADFFQDVAVLALRTQDEQLPASTLDAPFAKDPAYLTDGDKSTVCKFGNKKNEPVIIDLAYAAPIAARSLTVSPTLMHFNAEVEVQIPDGGGYKTVRRGWFDHGHSSLQRGPVPNGDMVLALEDVESDRFRIVIRNAPAGFELGEVSLSSLNRIDYVTEKWLNKLPNKGLPLWTDSQWLTVPNKSADGVVSTDNVIDLTAKTNNGMLVWDDAPQGRWEILRIGMTTTGTTNTPASPSAIGLEIDKMNRNVIRPHFDAYIGRILEGLTPDERSGIKRIIADSYETGPQNWTDDMRETFIAAYGYDPLPWLVTLTGRVVNSAEQTDRFLWDIRRLVADKVAVDYVGGLREICEEHGFTLWLENYGHWGFPSEALKYGGQSNNIGGEFWLGAQGAECRLAASAAHIYGKNKVFAESYTSSEPSFSPHPDRLRKSGDWSYTEGVNHGVLHLYVHQPYDKAPGMNPWYGTEFHRHNTWMAQGSAWVDYIRRCYFMLQQGSHVADVCYFIGEESPKENGWKDPKLSQGYNYDFINAEVIEKYMYIKDGRWTLPGGASYAVMALPPWRTMRPSLIGKLHALVRQGGVLAGTPPAKSPSLEGYPECDGRVVSAAALLWGGAVAPGDTVSNTVGLGAVYLNVPLNDVLERHGTPEDVRLPGAPKIKWVHRRLGDGDIYFLTNQGGDTVEVEASFRTTGFVPELWNAVTGTSGPLPEYSAQEGRTTIPLRFYPAESYFIVFARPGGKEATSAKNFTDPQPLRTLDGPWDIRFRNKWLGTDFELHGSELFEWTRSDDEQIKSFSGTATYTTRFTLSSEDMRNALCLTFEKIDVIATVRLNGQTLGTLWTAPYVIDISSQAREGENVLELDVTNVWVNQLGHQLKRRLEDRTIWLYTEPVRPDYPPQPSGLYGKVSLCRK